MTKLITTIALALAALTLAGCGGGPDLEAASDCYGFDLDTSGTVLQSTEFGSDVNDIACVLKALDTPAAVAAQMELSGTGDEEADGLRYTWSPATGSTIPKWRLVVTK